MKLVDGISSRLIVYHVTSRGNAREPIFIIDTNRVLFLDKNESALIARIKTPQLPLLANLPAHTPRIRNKVYLKF